MRLAISWSKVISISHYATQFKLMAFFSSMYTNIYSEKSQQWTFVSLFVRFVLFCFALLLFFFLCPTGSTKMRTNKRENKCLNKISEEFELKNGSFNCVCVAKSEQTYQFQISFSGAV